MNKITREQLADMLDGREYRSEMTKDEENLAKDNNLLVIFGASDDLMEFRGIIYDEIGCWDGGTIHFINGKLPNQDHLERFDDDIGEMLEFMNTFNEKPIHKTIEAVWCEKHNDKVIPWTYKTDIPHSTFRITEDNELCCIGIVIDGKDLK